MGQPRHYLAGSRVQPRSTAVNHGNNRPRSPRSQTHRSAALRLAVRVVVPHACHYGAGGVSRVPLSRIVAPSRSAMARCLGGAPETLVRRSCPTEEENHRAPAGGGRCTCARSRRDDPVTHAQDGNEPASPSSGRRPCKLGPTHRAALADFPSYWCGAEQEADVHPSGRGCTSHMVDYRQRHTAHWLQHFAARGYPTARPLAAGVEGSVYRLGEGVVAKVWSGTPLTDGSSLKSMAVGAPARRDTSSQGLLTEAASSITWNERAPSTKAIWWRR